MDVVQQTAHHQAPHEAQFVIDGHEVGAKYLECDGRVSCERRLTSVFSVDESLSGTTERRIRAKVLVLLHNMQPFSNMGGRRH